jgi:centromeric protein E
VEGVTEFVLESFLQFLMLVEKGETNKVTKATQFNLKSSRSHTILEIVLQKADKKESRLVLCDLAGSERFTDEKAKDKVLMAESNNINKSLSTLGK